MTTEQPNALRLADALDHLIFNQGHSVTRDLASAELRRLHAVNADLVEALGQFMEYPRWVDEATVPAAGVDAAPKQVIFNMGASLFWLRKATAALSNAKATGSVAAPQALSVAEPVANEEPMPYLSERLKDHTCIRVDNAGGTPGYTLYMTKLGRHALHQLYRDEAMALWINLGKALDVQATGTPS